MNAVARDPSPRSKPSKASFFSNPMASRSTTKLPKSESPSRQQQPPATAHPSSMSQVYNLNRAMGSSPELTLTLPGSNDCMKALHCPIYKLADKYVASSLPTQDDRSSNVPFNLSTTPDNVAGPFNAPKKKTSKHKFNILGRKASLKDDDPQPTDLKLGSSSKSRPPKTFHREPKTEKVLREKVSTVRNRSLERQTIQDDGYVHPGSSTNGHHSIQHGIRSTGTRAADGFGRAAKGLLGKLSNRTGLGDSSHSSSGRNIARDEAEAQKAAVTKNYKLVNRPLEDQTRITRICKRLEDCKDKTEYWLPAVAYRCIDYLNDKGMTHEGLYRVPGSEREIRNWIWRFDNGKAIYPSHYGFVDLLTLITEVDIDLLAEDELYDVNTISSMFKAWLRDLPDEVFPKSLQYKISAAVGNLSEQQGAPQMLKDELSNLPPFNYYLLFAVTAHITMLLNASKENKMTFHNLCVCFMPALKMEMPCFTWLILDWKNCWQGCSTERDFLEREYAILERKDPDYQEGEARVRPVQHFDRYDRYPSPQPTQEGLGYPPQENDSQSRPKPQRSNGSGSESQSVPASPPRPSTSPQLETPQISSAMRSESNNRREKPRPPPIAAKSNTSDTSSRSRRGSEPSSELPSWKPNDKGEKSSSKAADKSTGRQDLKQTPSNNRTTGRTELPEISPMKPLSPFGSLDDEL
jgi:hypothetical protein